MNQQPGCLCAAGLFSFLCMGILMPALFKPSPWGPTPLIKGRCREATEGIGKVAGRKARRMRGHFKGRASLEKSRRAGACPRRPWVFLFRKSTLVRIFCRGGPMWPPARETSSSVGRDDSARRLTGFRPAGRVSFPAMGKKPKDRRGRLQMSTSCS